MSTGKARPGLGTFALEEFSEGQKILLNPTDAEIKTALAKVQQRCRKNLLKLEVALAAYHQVLEEGEDLAHAGVQDCPRSFDYAITTTVIQVARLSDDFVACAIGRKQVYPGEKGLAPVRADPYEEPRQWLNQIITTFWTHLNDQQIAAIHQRAVTIAMRLAAERDWEFEHGYGSARAGIKRKLQLDALFKSVEPVYLSELEHAVKQIATALRAQGQKQVDWRAFQQKWPSISARYKRELLGLFNNKAVAVHELEALRFGPSKYSVSFTTWAGVQTIFRKTQIVFQINSSALSVATDAGHPSTFRLRRALRQLAEDSSHPVTTETVGWLRVHVDDFNRICFIDEVQSDVVEHLLSLAPTDVHAAAMAKEFSDWLVHGFGTVQHWAHSIGYRVAIHSQLSASQIEGKTPSERKWNVYYGALIKRFGLVLTEPKGYRASVYIES